MLEAFNNRGNNLQTNLVADSFQLFDELSSIANKDVIENRQQEFLSEIKALADSLRNTVLDTSEQKSVDKIDKKTKAFLQDVINKKLIAEKRKLDKQQKTNLEETIPKQMDSKLAVLDQQVDSQLSLSKLVEKSHQEQVEDSQSQMDTGQLENKDKSEAGKFEAKSNVEQQNINKFDELKNSIADKDHAVYSLNKSIDGIESRLANYEQEINSQEQVSINNENGPLGSKAKVKIQQIQKSIDTNHIAERNAQSLKLLKELVIDKSAISKVLQRQGDVKKYQATSRETQVQQDLTKFSANKNIPLTRTKITNPFNKVSQVVSQTVREITTNVINQIDTTAQHTTDTVADIRSLLHKTSADGVQINQQINQVPAGTTDLLKSFVGDSEEKQLQSSQPLIKPNQTKIKVTAGKEKQSQTGLSNAIAEIEEKKAVFKTVKKDKHPSEIDIAQKLEVALKTTKPNKNQSKTSLEDVQQDLSQKRKDPLQHDQSQLNTQDSKSSQQENENVSPAIPEELQTAVQWMAEEEVENKLVDLLSRQARLRGIDLS